MCVHVRVAAVTLFPAVVLERVRPGIWSGLLQADVGAHSQAHTYRSRLDGTVGDPWGARAGLTAPMADFPEEIHAFKVSCGQKGIYYKQSVFVPNLMILVIW